MSTNEVAPHDRAELLIPEMDPTITETNDRGWMETLGCKWPEEGLDEWLEQVNSFRSDGSHNQTALGKSPTELGLRKNIDEARRAFYGLFSTLSDDFHQGRGPGSKTYDTATSPDTFVLAQRYLHMNGVDTVTLLNHRPIQSLYSWQSWHEHFATLGRLGIDPVRTINATTGKSSFVTVSSGSIYEKLFPLYAAARAKGLPDPRLTVNKLVEELPVLLGSRPDKTRILSRIVNMVAPDDTLGTSVVQTLYIRPVEAVVTAYLRHGDHIRSIGGLLYHASRYADGRALDTDGYEPDILKGIIAQFPDDPVVRRYLKAYPMNDPVAAAERYEQHVRSRDNHKRNHPLPLLWQGPSALGDPKMPPYYAYSKSIESEQLNDEQLLDLTSIVREGEHAEEQLRNLNLYQDESEIARLASVVEHGNLARKALIARHLGMVVEIVDSCVERIPKIDLIGIANIGLCEYFIEELDTDQQLKPEYIRLQAAAAIMRKLTTYSPSYNGMSRHEVNKALAKVQPV